jgi:hypothetical protein
VHGMSSTSRRRSKLWRCCFGSSVLHWKLRCKTVASIFRVNLDCFQAHIERMSGDVRRQRSSEERYYCTRGALGDVLPHVYSEYRRTHANLPGGQVGLWQVIN